MKNMMMQSVAAVAARATIFSGESKGFGAKGVVTGLMRG